MKKTKRETIEGSSVAISQRLRSSEKHSRDKTINTKTFQIQPKQVRLSRNPRAGRNTNEREDRSHAMPLPPRFNRLKHVRKITKKGRPTLVHKAPLSKVPKTSSERHTHDKNMEEY